MTVRHSKKFILLLLMFTLFLITPPTSLAEAATLMVTSRADSGAGSLRQVILSAIPGDVIRFDTMVFPPANPATITLLSGLVSALPDISIGNLTIDASNAGVILDGRYLSTSTPTRGLRITSNGNVIKGLQIIRFPGHGIEILNGAKNNTIGGDWTVGSAPRGEGNIITLNGADGVVITGAGTNNNTVSGNLIGLDIDGTRDIRIQDMVVSPSYANDQTLFIGTKFNGVWKTADGGATWVEVNAGLTIQDVRALAISPNYTNDGTLFAGTANGGIFKTTNRGGSWTRVDGATMSRDVKAFVMSPNYVNDGHVFVATLGDGVFATTDGGTTWVARGGLSMPMSINSLLISPNYGVDRTLFAQSGSELYKSINQGYAWTSISSALSLTQSMAISPNFASDQTLFAGMMCGQQDYMFLKSVDGGNNWVQLGSISQGCVSELAFSPAYSSDRSLFTITNQSVLKSSDGGATWIDLKAGNFNLALAVSPSYATDHTVFVGRYFGELHKSTSGGGTWQKLNAGFTEEGNNAGVTVSAGAQSNTIGGNSAGKRNVISHNKYAGVQIVDSNTIGNIVSGNYIGTDANGGSALGNWGGVSCSSGAQQTTIHGNVISGNLGDGVSFTSDGNTITGNYIGINAAGTGKLGNGESGIAVWDGKNNRVGGATSAERNVIGGNGANGVSFYNPGAMNNTVIGNYIGTDATGTVALGNTNGVILNYDARQNVIGGTAAGERNIISGNSYAGVHLNGGDGNTVIGNYIGTDVNGTGRLGNGVSGIDIIGNGNQNMIGGAAAGQGNIIAYSGGNGITVTNSNKNTFSRNSITGNGYHGIAYSSGNAELSPPALVASTATTMTGISPLPNATIEIFSDDADEGRVYEGTVAADVNGNFTFTKAEGFQGPYVTATATDGDGNTSAFSSAVAIVGLKQVVSVVVTGQNQTMTVGDTQTLTARSGFSDATSANVTPVWTSLNPAVATVNATGLVTALAQGTTSIVASYGGITGKIDLTIGAPQSVVTQHYGNLILVAGGGIADTNTLKESTQYLSDLVYRRFKARLFTDEDIYYFNPLPWHDLNGDGFGENIVDDTSPTVAKFGAAITSWAAARSTDGPLYLYLIDHGGIDSFMIYPNEIITADQLKQYLDAFQASTGRKVVVIIEACKSGSFTDNLVVQGQNRIVVTSTDNQDAYMQLAGKISFSQFFLDRLLTGDSLSQSYLKAKNQLMAMGLPYSSMRPQLVEGNVNTAVQTMIGGDFAIASLFPEITETSSNMNITANATQDFYVKLSSLEGIEAVWAVVVPPDYVLPDPSQNLQAPTVTLPTITLTDPEKDRRYEGSYNNFTYNGDYRITFYARNTNGNISVSPSIAVTVTGGTSADIAGDINSDRSVTITDAMLVLQVTSGLAPSASVSSSLGEVNGDAKLGLPEVIYILQKAAGVR